MDLVRYLRVLRRRWRIIAILALLGAVAGAVLVPKPSSNPETGGGAWIAVHTLFDSSANSKNNASAKTVGAVTAEQAAFLVKSGDVPDRVAKELGGNANDLSDKVVARPNSNLGTIEITAQAQSPGEARKTADAFAEVVARLGAGHPATRGRPPARRAQLGDHPARARAGRRHR